jgi:hypothetical protein
MIFPSVRKLFIAFNAGLSYRCVAGFILFFLFAGQASAQKHFSHAFRTPDIVLEGRVYYGWTLDHHIEITPYKRHYAAYEISFQKATHGNTRWEYMYNYPLIGVSYWYSDLGKTEVLGSAHAIFPYINFPLLSRKGANLYFRLGVGIGYLTKKYDRYENYENLAIGSHFNGNVNLLIEARVPIGDRLVASAGLSLIHFSNGGIRQPNYGLNMPSANMAVAYRLTRENPYQRKKLLPVLYTFEFDGKKFINVDIDIAFGMKDMQSMLGRGNQYLVTAIWGNMLWTAGYKSRVGFGVDVSYDGSDEKTLELRGVYPEHNIQLVKTGINAAYELGFSRMAIMLNLGWQLTGLDTRDGYIYEKLALRFGLTDNLYTALTLKANYGKADFITLGVGYRIHIKYYK